MELSPIKMDTGIIDNLINPILLPQRRYRPMNELTLTEIRLHFGNLTKYFDTLSDLKNFIFDYPEFRHKAEIFINNDWYPVTNI